MLTLRIGLSIFANGTDSDPAKLPILETLNSVFQTFDRHSFTEFNLFFDPGPYFPRLAEVRQLVENYLGHPIQLHETTGLADGVAKSLVKSDSDYLFQLEHDWTFETALINHSLIDIVGAMDKSRVNYLRFNKRPNVCIVGHPFEVHPMLNMSGIPVCRAGFFSNNPHVVNRRHAERRYLPHIRGNAKKSSGVETEITAAVKEDFYIYGGANYPPTVRHTDGTKSVREFRTRGFLHKQIFSATTRIRALRHLISEAP
jgi:hypothetical protein